MKKGFLLGFNVLVCLQRCEISWILYKKFFLELFYQYVSLHLLDFGTSLAFPQYSEVRIKAEVLIKTKTTKQQKTQPPKHSGGVSNNFSKLNYCLFR